MRSQVPLSRQTWRGTVDFSWRQVPADQVAHVSCEFPVSATLGLRQQGDDGFQWFPTSLPDTCSQNFIEFSH